MIKTCVSGIILFISLCLTMVVNAAGPVPVIEKERIIFTNSKVLETKSYHVLHKDPLEAYRSHEPVRYQERAVLIEQWQRVIVSKHMNYFEGPRGEVRVYDYLGQLLNPATPFRGRVMVIGPTNRIFIGQYSRNYKVGKSLLLDKDGKSVAEVSQPEDTFDFALSKDGKLIVIYANTRQNGQTGMLAKVVDFNGRDIRTLEVTQAQIIEVEHEGKKYGFQVPGTAKTGSAKKSPDKAKQGAAKPATTQSAQPE